MGKPTTQRHADPQRGSSASRETFLGGDPTGKVTSFPSPERKAKTRTKTDLRARPYPVLIPDSEYLATCVQVFGPHSSRAYGEKIYVSFQILDGGHAGKKLPMFLRPSRFPTSRLYRSWVVANGGLPSRNATLSPRIFLGKIFRVSTVTVKPRHASGAPMPPVFLVQPRKLYEEIFSRVNGRAAGALEEEPGFPLSYEIAAELPLALDYKQKLLELLSEGERRKSLADHLESWLGKLKRLDEVKRKAAGNGPGRPA